MSNFYEGVVVEYLHNHERMFVHPQCLIRLGKEESKEGGLKKGRHWYCDAMAVSFKQGVVFLCEVSYAQRVPKMMARLRKWSGEKDGDSGRWSEVCKALQDDFGIPGSWAVKVWLFVPAVESEKVRDKVKAMAAGTGMPEPKITPLEEVVPWQAVAWNEKPRTREEGKP